ncbi:MAG TPA: hypothetical protein VK416_08590 [Thermoanaerobaculia bacterium]|nr:hypothetical protein [Thermoanaerobaculia bacterium]
MKFRRTLSFLALFGLSAAGLSEKPLACDPNALSNSQRERHRTLGEKLRGAVADRVELANGYSLVLDLDRLTADSAGFPFCVVEVAEWVDLESRCCPFLEFGIDVPAKGRVVRLRLTGGNGVKSFLKSELSLLAEDAGRGERRD